MTEPVWHQTTVSRSQRWNKHGLSGATVWLTGLSGSGKSTLANELAKELLNTSRLAIVLDADNLRHGLNSDLGYSDGDRVENVRRVAETALLFAEAGLVAIVPIISPFADSREFARKIHLQNNLKFVEVHVATSVEECERRDTKGLYARARTGELKGLSGVDGVYEPPTNPEVTTGGQEETMEMSVQQILNALLVKAGD